jgi:integral membrane protein (TIGR01906 family)
MEERKQRFWVGLWQAVIIVTLPLLLLLLNARLLMTEVYLQLEYNRPNFPADPFGMTTEERLTYAPLALRHMLGEGDLAALTFPDGGPLFNEREVRHMNDVQAVAWRLFRIGYVMLGGFVVSVTNLAASRETREALRLAVLRGSGLTIALLVGGLALVLFGFDLLFVQFHALFFEGSTWVFPTSDTLIRLFPERFWIDVFTFVFGGALVEAVVLGVAARLLKGRVGGPEAAG